LIRSSRLCIEDGVSFFAGFPAATILVLATATFFAAFASGLAGFAFVLIAIGAYLFVLAPPDAIPILLAASLFAQLATLPRFFGAIRWARLAPFLLGGAAGIPLGAELLQRIDVPSFKLAVGGFLVIYSSYVLIRPITRPLAAGAGADAAVGLLGGVMGGLSGLSGALPTLWCGLRGWSKDEQRAIYQPFILLAQATALLWLGGAGAISRTAIAGFLLIMPPFALGVWSGLMLYRRVSERQFSRIVLGLLLLSGLILIASVAA
jgi:uncharacterized membrane protein YfcA